MKKGFTLIELLIVIVIIATLAVAVFVALDPAKRIQDTRDARRTSDVQNILTAIGQYMVDNNGDLPLGIDETQKQIGIDSGLGCKITNIHCSTDTICVNLSYPLSNYLKTIPTDPQDGTDAQTKYAVVKDANNIVTITACNTEQSTTIKVSR